MQSFEGADPEKLTLVLLFLFKGVLDNTFNGDVIQLAKYRAADLLHGSIEQKEVFDICDTIVRGLRRRPSPVDKMFY